MKKMKVFLIISADARSDDARRWEFPKFIKIVSRVEDCDLIVVIGGDGTLLHAIHKYHHLGKPFFGINRGTVGFLLNPIQSITDLVSALEGGVSELNCISLEMLEVVFKQANGNETKFYAFNDVYLESPLGFSNRFSVSGDYYGEKLVAGNGIIIATPQGSTAYTRNAGGPILPLVNNIMAITSICSSFRSIRDIVEGQEIRINVTKGKAIAHADSQELGDVVGATIRPASDMREVKICFMNNHNFKKIRYRPMEVKP